MATQQHEQRVPRHPERLCENYARMVRLAGAQRRVLASSWGRVHVIVAGDGPPVVHLHGNNTSSLSHLPLLPHLTTVRSYLIDRPGLGLSDPAPFPRKAFRRCAVQFVDDVLNDLQLPRVVLAGASGGGTWALWYALAHPQRVGGLVLLGSVPLLPGARIPLGIRLVATPVLGQVLSSTLRPNRRMMLHLMSSMGEADTIVRHPDLLDSLVEAARDPVATTANVAELQALLSPFGTPTATRIGPDQLARLVVPTLMIWGDRDPVVSVADAEAAAGLIPDARLEVLPGGHVPWLGNPVRVAQLLQSFARSQVSAD